MAGGTAIAIARDKEKLSNDIFDLFFICLNMEYIANIIECNAKS